MPSKRSSIQVTTTLISIKCESSDFLGADITWRIFSPAVDGLKRRG
jgi:hypothetical protein